MTKDEYYIMKIRQLKILRRQEDHIRYQIEEIESELEDIPNQKFSQLKMKADGVDAYHKL